MGGTRKLFAVALAAVLLVSVAAFAQGPEAKTLPEPDKTGGMPLMQALAARQSSRSYSDEKLSDEVLSNLLWAAFGMNRPDGRRTAPSAMNRQEIDIYVATADGLYLYDAKAHALTTVLEEDIREATGTQSFVKDAPINLVYVADFSRMGRGSDEDKTIYSAADTGFIGQNVYLFCASEGLSTVVRGLVDKAPLAEKMKLRPEQKIVLAQTVGYPPGE